MASSASGVGYGPMRDATADSAAASPSGPHLVRRLGLWSSIGVVIGITIGSGIFRTPATIAARVPDPGLMLAVWVVGGAITLCGALSLAELAAAMPETGGIYVYLREGWGRLPAFLFGWAQLVLIRASALGGIASVFGSYLLRSLGVDVEAHQHTADFLSAGAIVVAAAVNIRGVQLGAFITNLSTIAKFGALALLALAALVFGGQAGGTMAHFTTGGAPVEPALFGLALISVLWAYDGFADISFASGEIREPHRNLPRAIIIGTLLLIVIYLLANLAYLYILPVSRMPASKLVAADTMAAMFGNVGVAFISLVVMISAFGSLNGSMLASPRIFFAMAEDRLFFRSLASVHPRFKTPYVAILLAAALGVGMVLTRSFEQLTDTFVLTMWPFYALSVAAIYRLRRTRPGMSRPYRVIGYPVVPAIFIAGATYLVVNAFVASPLQTAAVFGVLLTGVPVYYVFFRR